MTTAGCRPIDRAIHPPSPAGSGDHLERLQETTGLTWRKLPTSATVTERGLILRRRELPVRSGPGHDGEGG